MPALASDAKLARWLTGKRNEQCVNDKTTGGERKRYKKSDRKGEGGYLKRKRERERGEEK